MATDAVQAVGSWLHSRWQVCVPQGWLQACVEWLQQEAGGRPLSLAQLQQQTLEQWLQTDLRSLGMSTLPAAAGEALKTELRGNICVQLDSLQDVSQPAYSQLQRLRGSDCSNDQIGAVTQATQRPWEAAPTRMLMLQLTDGVRSVEAMEYKPVPQLNTSLPAGTKLLLQGPITCRLGVLLLGPQNVQVLGGEVEELLRTNSQTHVLCRVLGLPEPEQAEEEEEAEAEGASQERPIEAAAEEDLDDMELMASLEAVEEGSLDSGYRSASLLSTAPSRPSPRRRPFPLEEDPGWGNSQDAPDVNFQNDDNEFQDDDIPLEELDGVLSQHVPQEARRQANLLSPPEPTLGASPLLPARSRPPVYTSPRAEQEHGGQGSTLSPPEPTTLTVSRQVPALRPPAYTRARPTLSPEQEHGKILAPPEPALAVLPQVTALRPPAYTTPRPEQDDRPPQSGTIEGALQRAAAAAGGSSDRASEAECAVGWDGPPFSYLWNLPADVSREVRVHAFVVTLKGNMRSGGGHWRLDVCLSDGSAYVDAELGDGVLEGLIGLSAAETRTLKRTPEGQARVTAGIQRCQRALVDLCGIMTLQVGPGREKPLVLEVTSATQSDCQALQQRVELRRARC